jgi:hypothetical protein
MISYSLTTLNVASPWLYTKGYRVADTDDVERLARGITCFVWSGIAWKDGHRTEANFLYSDWCVLDFDDPEYSLAEALRAFCDVVHIIGTTKSHQKITPTKPVACDRFRVALKWSERITELRVYRWNMQKMRDRYAVDKKALDGARYFFPCREIIQKSSEGELWDVDTTVPDWFEKPPDIARYQNARRLGVWPHWVKRHLEQEVPHGARHGTWYGLAKDLTRMGFAPNEILAYIVKSATYKGVMSPQGACEIIRIITDAVKATTMEVPRGTE